MGDAKPSAADVLELVTRLAGLLVKGGYEGTLFVDQCLRSVANAYGYKAEVLALAESAVVSIDGAARVVTHAPEIPQLDQVSAFKPWLAKVTAGEVPIGEARRLLEQIAAMPVPYPAWLRVLGVVLFSVGFGVSIQPTWQEVWVTALLAVVVGVIQVTAARADRLGWLAPLASSTVVALAVLAADRQGWVSGGTVELMIPVLFVFIPGDAITMAALELGVGRLTAGTARLMQSLAGLIALAFGPLLAAAILGVRHSEIFEQAEPQAAIWVGLLGWSAFTVGVMLVFGMRRADLPWALAIVLGTYAVQLVAVRLFSDIAGTFVAAALMAACCLVIGHRRGTPPAYVLYLAPFFVLTPGAHGLRGLEAWLGGTVQGVQDVTSMFMLIAAIALGMLTAAGLVPRTLLPLPDRS